MPSIKDLIATTRPDNLSAARQLLDRARRDGIQYKASPEDWRDEVLYFLLPDRFSDGKEAGRSVLSRTEISGLRTAASRPGWNWHDWAESGKRWQGGTLNGIRGKLDYLRGLGVSCLWIGPIFRQRVRVDTYHGYGIQDFLEVDPRFGTREELRKLVEEAHAKGLRIVLDIIMNHSGDNWGYVAPGNSLNQAFNQPPFLGWPNFYGNPSDDGTKDWQLAWRDEQQQGFTTSASALNPATDGVWPKDLQQPERFTRAGMGSLGDGKPEDPHAEHKRTDFFALKDFAVDVGDTMSLLAECFKYWIALTDCDGFRIDTLKHVSLEEGRNFCGAIREFAETLGKRNFFLVGEVAGGDAVQDLFLDRLAVLQRNLTAALDIGEMRGTIRGVAKGLVRGSEYLDGFKEGSEGFGSHRSLGNRHVSIVDDHDHVSGEKIRFSASIPDNSPVKDYQIATATALQLFTLGIPCIYYGSEQAFAGPAQSQIPFVLSEGWNDGSNFGDRYLRETMFGADHPRASFTQDLNAQLTTTDAALPGFGTFGTVGKHCFDEQSPAYVRIAAMLWDRV